MVLEEINGEISQQENGIPFRFVKVPLPFVFAIIFLPPVSSFFFCCGCCLRSCDHLSMRFLLTLL